MYVLGISAFYHDAAAALICDGEIIAAAQEERFTRKKHDADFPRQALDFCLAHAGISLEKIDFVAFYDKPFLKFERLLETYLAFAPRGFKSFKAAIPLWLRQKLFLKDLLHKTLQRDFPGHDWNNRLLFSEHHLSHAASAFFPSPFASAAVLTLDGVGEWATTDPWRIRASAPPEARTSHKSRGAEVPRCWVGYADVLRTERVQSLSGFVRRTAAGMAARNFSSS